MSVLSSRGPFDRRADSVAGCGWPIAVVGADLDHRQLGIQPAQQRADALVLAAVVGDLQHLHVGQVERRGDVALGVGGQEYVRAAVGGEHDDGVVVGLVVRIDGLSRGMQNP